MMKMGKVENRETKIRIGPLTFSRRFAYFAGQNA